MGAKLIAGFIKDRDVLSNGKTRLTIDDGGKKETLEFSQHLDERYRVGSRIKVVRSKNKLEIVS